IFGIRAVIEAIQSGKTIDKVFIQKGLQGALFQQLNTLLKKNEIGSSYVPVEKLNRLTKNNHQGVVANISPIEFYDLDTLVTKTIESDLIPLLLLLDQLSDVRNFGAIIRTAERTSVTGINNQARGSDSVTADTVKTSSGAVYKSPICKGRHIKDAVNHMQASG